MRFHLVLLHAPARSGKSTVAHYLVDKGFVLIKIAEPLKAMFRTLMLSAGCDAYDVERMIEGDLKEVPHDVLQGKTPRYAMQTLGKEWSRDGLGPDIWLEIAIRRIQHEMWRGKPVVVDDIRYTNELEALQRHFSTTSLYILRPGLEPVNDHVAEAGINPKLFDRILVNEGSISDLRRKVDQAVFGETFLAGTWRNGMRIT